MFPSFAGSAHDAFCAMQARRQGIKYELLPPGMHRQKMNSSRFDKRSRTIFWHVHWQFPAANESVHDQRVSEQTPLMQVLQQHISLTPGNSLRRHALRAYVEAGVQNLQILMKKERCPVQCYALHALLMPARLHAACNCFCCWDQQQHHALHALLTPACCL